MSKRLGVAIFTAAIALAFVPTANAVPSPKRTAGVATGEGVNLTIPWAIGGLRIERDGSRRVFPGDWPTLPVHSMRIWDARTAWLNIEPAQDQWDFTRLDAFVAKAEAKGVKDILMSLGGTPQWAAQRQLKTDAGWLGPGSASPPKHWADWAEFVSNVAQRYKGRIQGYEIWNEPNSITYWSGSNAQWAKLVTVASEVISKADPDAKIVIGGFAAYPRPILDRIEPMLKALSVTQPRQVRPTAVSFHWYPYGLQIGQGAVAIATSIRETLKAVGIADTQLWITEMNVRNGASLSAVNQVAAMDGMMVSLTRASIQRSWWYAWTDLGPANLIQIYGGTPAARWLMSN